jgi:hypothetical protein
MRACLHIFKTAFSCNLPQSVLLPKNSAISGDEIWCLKESITQAMTWGCSMTQSDNTELCREFEITFSLIACLRWRPTYPSDLQDVQDRT